MIASVLVGPQLNFLFNFRVWEHVMKQFCGVIANLKRLC